MNLEPRIPLREILQPVLNLIGAQPFDAPQDPDEQQRLTEMRRNKYIEFIGLLNRHQILRHERIRQLRQRIPEQQNQIQTLEDYIVQKNVLEYHIVPLMGNLYIGQPIDLENQREILSLLNQIDDLREPELPELNVDPDEQEVIEDLDPMEENKPIGLEILERRILKDFQLRRHGERRREERIQQLEEEQRRSIRRLGILFGEEIRRREEIVRMEEQEQRHREQMPQLEAEIVPEQAPQNEQPQEPPRRQEENDRRIREERRNRQIPEIPRNERVVEEEERIRDLQQRLEIHRNPRRLEPARLNHPDMVEGDPVKPEFQNWDFQYWSKQHFREWVELVLPENLRQNGIIDRIRVMNLDGAVIPELATDDSMQRLLELTPHQFHLLKCHSMKVINKYNDERRQRFGENAVQ
ncbi:hypothetical protein B9Z55_012677 [Caenorhabditis nigoni]|uniref:SAM domain-containing protein n=1 Tax=Caenorhabditis nigoni TaxID=1611254 RepID=A0A2G5TYD6_9PELO|nr:hypothetical protein B9Z55_012677 [Caenorhabditis nigoni]